MNLAIPFMTAAALAVLGALPKVGHSGSDSGALNPSPRQASATLESSNDRSRAASMLQPA
jgi:hypothetical protein